VLPIPKAVVSRKYIEKGERVQAGQPVFQIMDLSRVRVAFGVSDTKISHFRMGQTVNVTAEAAPGEQFAGRITKIVPAADLKTRTFEVEMTIDEPRGLKPGMVVTILVGREETVVLLPMTAVHRGARPDEYTVFTVVDENGVKLARQRRVKLGGISDNRIRLLPGSGSQVGPGDVIVVSGSFRLTEGQAVRVLELDEPKLRIGM
jgi:multidrug efflux system membrane fusion protein